MTICFPSSKRSYIRRILIRSAAVLTVMCLCVTAMSVFAAGYMRGDADNSGEVDITDVTLLQRVIAEMTNDTDGMITKRGDVDGSGELEVTDVTFIQRSLAGMPTPYIIGEVIGEEPTQEPTQPPTQKPTQQRDPYELPIV